MLNQIKEVLEKKQIKCRIDEEGNKVVIDGYKLDGEDRCHLYLKEEMLNSVMIRDDKMVLHFESNDTMLESYFQVDKMEGLEKAIIKLLDLQRQTFAFCSSLNEIFI